MFRSMVIAFAVVLAAVSPQFAADEKRVKTIAEHSCQFKLPGDEWEWIANPPPQITCIAANPAGDRVTLTVRIAGNPAIPLDEKFAEDFDRGFYGNDGFDKKLAGTFITFRTLRCYHTEGVGMEGKRIAARVLVANGKAYILTAMVSDRGEQASQQIERIMDGFEFTTPPVAPAPAVPNSPSSSNSDDGRNVSYTAGRIAGYCLMAALVVALVGYLFRKKKPQ